MIGADILPLREQYLISIVLLLYTKQYDIYVQVDEITKRTFM
jgi:hypothetical protein